MIDDLSRSLEAHLGEDPQAQPHDKAGVFEYRRCKSQGLYALLSSGFLVCIGIWAANAGSPYSIFLFGLGLCGFLYGIYTLNDRSVRLRMDESGITAPSWTGEARLDWQKIQTYSFLEVQHSASLKFFLEFYLVDGRKIKVEVGNLDQPTKQILEDLESFRNTN